MNPWIAILFISGTAGLVAYLSTRRHRAASTQSTNSEVAEK